jgi:hypothetical protein
VVTSHDTEYSISNIQLKIMHIFCRNIDLGMLDFYFSSKNCSSKVDTSLEKVVVLVTLSTAKLSLQFLDFSVVLYGFYKIQSRHTKGEDSFCNPTLRTFCGFTTRSLVRTKHPEITWSLIM